MTGSCKWEGFWDNKQEQRNELYVRDREGYVKL